MTDCPLLLAPQAGVKGTTGVGGGTALCILALCNFFSFLVDLKLIRVFAYLEGCVWTPSFGAEERAKCPPPQEKSSSWVPVGCFCAAQGRAFLQGTGPSTRARPHRSCFLLGGGQVLLASKGRVAPLSVASTSPPAQQPSPRLAGQESREQKRQVRGLFQMCPCFGWVPPWSCTMWEHLWALPVWMKAG